MQLPEGSRLQLGGSKVPDLSVEKVKDPLGGAPEVVCVAVQEARMVTGTELGLHTTEVTVVEVIAKLKDPVPAACNLSPG